MGIIKFIKYQATGNDFIMIDDRNQTFDTSRIDRISRLCDRRFGIGADGVILIRDHSQQDFEMVYFNPDGSQSLCGNGSRCALKFAQNLGMIEATGTFKAIDGIHRGHFDGDWVYIRMHDIPGIQTLNEDAYFVDTGSPHYITLVSHLEDLDVMTEGRRIRNLARFSPGGTNVNFVQVQDGACAIRTYERGVEAETYSCGTGVTAVALVMGIQGFQSPVTLATRGGELNVSFNLNEDGSFADIFLIGPAKEVFQGTVEVDNLTVVDAPF